jgi:hypothetical protein
MSPFSFFDLKDIGLLSSLMRFFIFFERVACTEYQSYEFLLSLKRIAILLLLMFVLPALMVWNHLGFFLDDILFPDWKHQIVEKPLFLVGNARSGTTWLHRLVAMDEETFTRYV